MEARRFVIMSQLRRGQHVYTTFVDSLFIDHVGDVYHSSLLSPGMRVGVNVVNILVGEILAGRMPIITVSLISLPGGTQVSRCHI